MFVYQVESTWVYCIAFSITSSLTRRPRRRRRHGKEGEKEGDNAVKPDRFEKSFEGVGAQKTASISGNEDRSKAQLEGWRTHQDVTDLFDCVID